MADIRYLNQFGMPGGFNITSGEPIDSRAYVADINHIYSEENWKTVKPYNGLIVSSADGQVRVCVDAENYTQPEAWKEVGSASSDDVTNIQQDIINIQNTINGTEENPGLVARVDALEDIDHGQYVVKDGDKVLSTNDYTTEEKEKLDGIADGAQVNVIETITVNGGDALAIIDKNVDITIEAPVYNSSIETEEVEGVVTVKDGDNAPTTKAVYDYVGTVKSVVDNVVSTLEDKVNAIETWKLQVVTADEGGLPVIPPNDSGIVEISHKTIYLVPSDKTGDNNIYNEFIYIDNGDDDYWEKLGEFKSDFDPTGLNELIEGLGTRIGNIENQLANYDTLVSDVDNLKNAINDPESGLAKVKEIADGAAKKAADNELNLTNNYYTKGETEEKIAEIVTGGTIELTGYVKFEDVAVANTYGEDGSITVAGKNGTMSVADKEKLDSISTMTEEDIDKILV